MPPHRHFRFAGSIFLCALLAAPALAQRAPDDAIEEVVVTGTRRSDLALTDSLSPINLLSAEDLQTQGFVELDDLLRTAVPSYQVGRHPIDDGSTLVRPAKLRGLSSDQTLVLVNGKRRHRGAVIAFISDALTTGSQGPDVSTIPPTALARVEVLRDGASAQYGSDAIAGVVNFILKDADSGGSFDARFSEYYEGDGATTHLSGNIGLPLGVNGFLNLTGEYVDQDDTRRNVLRTDVAGLREKRTLSMSDAGGLDENAQIWGTPFLESFSLFANAGYELSGTARLYAFGNYAEREVEGGFFFRNPDTRNGVFAVGDERLVGIVDHALYKEFYDNDANDACEAYRAAGVTRADFAGDDAGFAAAVQAEADRLATLAADANCFSWNERFPNGFTPRFGGSVLDYSAALGMDGERASGLRYDFSLYHGRHEVDFLIFNTVNAALGPENPEDFRFDPGVYAQEETHVQLNFAQLFESGPLGGTPLHIAFGAEYREETFAITAGDEAAWSAATQSFSECLLLLNDDATDDPAGRSECTVPELLLLQGFTPATNGFSGFAPNQEGEWSRENFALYLDFENEFSEELRASAALRFEDYEDFGSTLEAKLAAAYHITDELLLRGTASTGFRAPTPGQSNVRNVTTTFAFGGVGDLIESGLVPPTDPVAAHFGAVPLEPEESTNITLGLGWHPTSGLSVTLDVFWIEVQDRLAVSDNIQICVEDTPDKCAEFDEFLTEAEFVAFQESNPGLREGSTLNYFTNSWDTETKGVELFASWDTDHGALGTTQFTLSGSHIDTTVTARDASTINDRRHYNIQNLLPKTRFVLTATHHWNAWRVTARANYWGSWSVIDDSAFSYAACPQLDCENGPTDYLEEITFDLEAAYILASGVTLQVGGQNIFDENPDRSPRGESTGQLYHESAPFGPNGGFWYARLRYDF